MTARTLHQTKYPKYKMAKPRTTRSRIPSRPLPASIAKKRKEASFDQSKDKQQSRIIEVIDSVTERLPTGPRGHRQQPSLPGLVERLLSTLVKERRATLQRINFFVDGVETQLPDNCAVDEPTINEAWKRLEDKLKRVLHFIRCESSILT